MNYRHAFHAGNHTEVFKHAALTFVLEALVQKPQPFVVLDTHAGIGLYDLTSDEAQRTREYEAGVAKLAGAAAEAPFPKALRGEFLTNPLDGVTLAGGGLLILNTPWKLDDRLAALCGELSRILGDGRATWAIDWLTPS